MMKVLDAILMADKLRDNAIDREQKLVWLNELELKIQSRILRTAPDDMIEYDLNNDEATEMLVPRPFDKVYYLWLCAMIDYGNAEFDKYQNDMAMANAAYDDYAKWFMRLFHSDPQNVLYIGGTTKYGLSAYQISCNHGFVGTEEEWVDSLHGKDGKDAYQVAVEKGYTGTEDEFYAQLGVLADLEESVRACADAAASDAAKAEKAKSSAAESEGNAKAYAEGGTVQTTTYDESGNLVSIKATEVTGAKRYQENAAGSATRSAQAMTRAAAYAEGGTAPTALIGNVSYPAIDTIGAKGYMEQAQEAADRAEAAALEVDGVVAEAADAVRAQVAADADRAALAAQDAESSAAAAQEAAQEAAQAAGGGVTSFNGRTGSVSPQSGDYTAGMVGAVATGEKGTANGVASLDASGKVPSGQLPEMNYDAAGAAAAVQQNLNNHAANGTMHVTAAERTAWNAKLDKTGDGSNVTAAFTAASTRANIATGEKLSVIFGKLAKWFADLKTVAFSGSYSDLSNKPSIPSKVSDLTNDNGYLTAVAQTDVQVSAATDYTTNRVRGISLYQNSAPGDLPNGCIAGVYTVS